MIDLAEEDVGIVWHQRDLRTPDNPALKQAAKNHDHVLPVWIYDEKKKLLSDWKEGKRLNFRFDCLKDLKSQYENLGGKLRIARGSTEKILVKLQKRLDNTVYFNLRAGLPRETKINRSLAEKKGFKAVKTHTAVNHEEDSRKNWSSNTMEWFEQDIISEPRTIETPEINHLSKLSEIESEFKVEDSSSMFPTGGRKRCLQKLENFSNNIEDYAGCISSPKKAQKHTSHLSPFLAFGCISVREVYQRIDTKNESANMFKERLIWHEHFHQKLWDNPQSVNNSVNPVYRYLNYNNRNDKHIKKWKKGETGFPMVDASMRALRQEGWLNFRMRAMCASFFSYILKQYWKDGADYFYNRLIDADPAINYQQWQMQSGLVGVHANRVYDPMKQQRENDPEGEFIKEYVPELNPVPKKYLDRPWKMPEKMQKEKGVIIGEDYPLPIVEYEREAKKARKLFSQLADRAREAVSHPEILKRASLSERHDKRELKESTSWDKINEEDQSVQNSLDKFIDR